MELALLVCVASVFDVFKALSNFDVSWQTANHDGSPYDYFYKKCLL